MLNKKVCMNCNKELRALGEMGIGWDDKDEDDWEDGYVYCPEAVDSPLFSIVFVGGDPPAGCPRKMEHAVALRIENVEQGHLPRVQEIRRR